jgi:hypothetical protein
MEPFVETQEE